MREHRRILAAYGKSNNIQRRKWKRISDREKREKNKEDALFVGVILYHCCSFVVHLRSNHALSSIGESSATPVASTSFSIHHVFLQP